MNLIKSFLPVALLLLLLSSCEKNNCPDTPVNPTLPSTFLINGESFTGDTLKFTTRTLEFRPDIVLAKGDYLWNLGDGTVSDKSTITHTYSRNGVYSIDLTYEVFDDCGGAVSTYEDYIIEIQ